MPPTDACAPTRHAVYAQSFTISAAAALTAYFSAPLLLARGIPVESIGLVYTAAAFATIGLLVAAPRLFTKFGNYRSFLSVLATACAATVSFAVSEHALGTVISFIVMTVSIAGIGILLDIFLKGSMTGTGGEGATRAKFISASNIAWVVFPFIAGMLSVASTPEAPFLVASGIFALALGLALWSLSGVRRHTYRDLNISETLATIMKKPDLRGVFIAQFLLRIFYASMVIYMPVYLTQVAKLSLVELGIITSIGMAAFLLFEFPVGFLGDTRYGEKEFMLAGFVIIATSVALIPLVPAGYIALWGVVFFMTRVGAALVEITTESYFFKKTGADDADRVGAFRALGPISYIIGPLVGSAIVSVAPLSYVFIALAGIMTLGVPATLLITDTR